jgi:hypothetical protein
VAQLKQQVVKVTQVQTLYLTQLRPTVEKVAQVVIPLCHQEVVVVADQQKAQIQMEQATKEIRAVRLVMALEAALVKAHSLIT